MHKYTRDATVYTTVATKALTIRIKSETHKRLKNFGTLGDTFDSLINKALDCLERERETEAMISKWHPLQKKLADESYKTWGYEIEKEVDKPTVKKAGDEWK